MTVPSDVKLHSAGGFVRFIAAATLLFGIFSLSATPSPAAQLPRENVEKKLNAMFSGITSANEPGLAVLVQKDGKAIFEQGYGARDLRTNPPIDAQTNFRLASLTKQFTAMAVMLLVHDGKLSYDETLAEIFSEFPQYGRAITIRNLLNHTSGLPDYEDLMDTEEKSKGRNVWSPEHQIRDAEVLQLLEKATRGKFAPGTKWEYSNSGYVLLGLIVSKVSGEPFADVLRERIFSPLKMEHTLVFAKGENEIPNRAYGHSKRSGVFIETDQSSTSATQGDGGIYSNLDDLSKWDDALRRHTLLSEKEYQAALTPAKLPRGAPTKLAEDAPESMRGLAISYGFGWFLNPHGPHPLMWHYGETLGFETAIQRYTRDNLTIIILCNRTDLDPNSLALKAADLFFNSLYH